MNDAAKPGSRPMTAMQMAEALMQAGVRSLENSVVRVRLHAPGGIGASPAVDVVGATFGFDWDSGSFLVDPSAKLTQLSAEDVAAIRSSVSKGQSWHAYEAQKQLRQRIAQLEAELKQREVARKPVDIARIRKDFESIFGPMPSGCTWAGNGYCATSYGSWAADKYADSFNGFFKACSTAAAISDVDAACVSVLTKALDKLVQECMGDGGEPVAPSRRGLMAARSMLPASAQNTLVREKK